MNFSDVSFGYTCKSSLVFLLQILGKVALLHNIWVIYIHEHEWNLRELNYRKSFRKGFLQILNFRESKAEEILGTIQMLLSSVIRQKGQSQNGCFKKTKHAKFSEKRTCAYQRVRNVHLSKNLACFLFLKRQFWDSSFCLITDDFLQWS